MKWLLAAFFVGGPAYWAATGQFTTGWAVGWAVFVVLAGVLGMVVSPNRAWPQAIAALVGGVLGALTSLVTTVWVGVSVSLLQLGVALAVIAWCRVHATRSPI